MEFCKKKKILLVLELAGVFLQRFVPYLTFFYFICSHRLMHI